MKRVIDNPNIWTEQDEDTLRELQERKAVTQERQSAALMQVIKAHVGIKSGRVSDVGIYDLRNAMIAHGGEFRDALEPFDHMGRPKVVADTSFRASDWIKHVSKECPVDDMTEVEVEFGDGQVVRNRAGNYNWNAYGLLPSNQIVKYRVVGV